MDRNFSRLALAACVSAITFALVVVLGPVTAQSQERTSQAAFFNALSKSAPIVTSDSAESKLTVEQLQAEIAKLDTDTRLTEDQRNAVSTSLNQALTWLKSESESLAHAAEYKQQIAVAPQKIAELRRSLVQETTLMEITIPANASLAQLESKVTELEQIVQQHRQSLKNVNQFMDSRAENAATLAKDISDTEARIKEASLVGSTAVAEDFSSQIRVLERQARLQGLRANLQLKRIETKRLDALAEQWPLERDVVVRRLSAYEKQLAKLRSIVENWRRNESVRLAQQARKTAKETHPILRALATRNAQIAEQRIATAVAIKETTAELQRIQELSTKLEENSESAHSKVEHAGEATSTGILLRRFRGDLPRQKDIWRRRAHLSEASPKAHLLLIELKDERRDVADINAKTESVIAQLDPQELVKFDPNSVKLAVSQLLTKRRDLLAKLIADEDKLLRDLSELDVANEGLNDQVVELRGFLDERVLWVRSDEMLSVEDFRKSTVAFAALLDPSNWNEAIRSVCDETIRRPSALAAAIGLLILAFAFRQRLSQKLKQLCEPPVAGKQIEFGRSLTALAISVIMSASWPAILLAIGYKLSTAHNGTEFVQGLGNAFVAIAGLVWSCQLIREICSEGHVGDKLFGWPLRVLAVVRRALDLAILCGTPLIAVLFLTQNLPIDGGHSLHRLTLIVILTLIAIESYTLLRPSSPLMRAVTLKNPDSLVSRLKRPICFISVAVPMALVCISIYGYHYSATKLSSRFAESLIAIAVVIVLHALALRWLRVKGYNRTINEHLAASAKALQDPTSANTTIAEEIAADEEINWQKTADTHIRELLRYVTLIVLAVGGWFVWAEVLPALGVLDRVALWDNVVKASEVIRDPSGNATIQHFEKNVPVTLKDVLASILIIMVTLRVGHQLTSFFEVTLSDRLPIDRGARHAIAVLVRYAFTLAGIIAACYMVQLSWARVQWLAAAMTVGLGFGLQEIFANLVSGLIILFERPVRVGDVVTVGEVTGTVSRMQMRATTITDFDRRELIVPNKRFITDNVINWTLTDPICRTIVPVGVAYGTETETVNRILLGVAHRSSMVLSAPEPVIVFSGFGESTLDFELRVFIPHREQMPAVISHLNTEINREFKRNEIEIAFPQQDLHIKSIEKIVPATRAA